MCYVWTMVFICHYYYWGNENMWNTSYFLCTIGVLFMALGFWSSFSYKSLSANIQYDYKNSFLSRFIKTFILVELLRLLYCCYVIIYQIAGGSWMSLISDGTMIRNAYLAYESSSIEKIFVFATNLCGYIGFVVMSIYFSKKLQNRWILLIVVGIIELIMSIVTMSKLSFSLFLLTFFISYLSELGSLSLQKKMLNRLIPLGLLLLLGFFVFIGYQRNYMETRGSLQEGVLDGIINYFGGPLEALNIILTKGVQVTQADHGIVYIGRTDTNVYTCFFYFHKILPYIGFSIFPFLMGYLAGKLYKPWKHNLFNDVSNAWICVILSFSFFDLLLKFTVFQFLFIFLWWFNRRFSYKIYSYNL